MYISRLGLGIALEFKRRYGTSGLKTGPVGSVCVVKKENNYIFHLITKEYYYKKPTYRSLKSSLEAMAEYMTNNGISSVSMPKIGCVLDRLNWSSVEKIISSVLKDYNVTVYIY